MDIICSLIVGVLFTIFFMYNNQHRGGGPFRINTFLDDKFGFDLGRSLFTSTILLFGVLSALMLVIPQLTFVWVAGSTIGWLLWGVNGWGSYFDNGTWTQEHNDKPEVPWIDWILYLTFGPKWNPLNSSKPNRDKTTWDISEHGLPFPLALGFVPPDLVTSPNGDIRPYKWRRARDTVGLFLRHCHSILFFAFQAWFWANPLLMLLTIPFAGLVTLFYYISNIDSVDVWIRTKTPHLFATNKYLEFKPDPNGYAEIGGGLAWALAFITIALLVL